MVRSTIHDSVQALKRSCMLTMKWGKGKTNRKHILRISSLGLAFLVGLEGVKVIASIPHSSRRRLLPLILPKWSYFESHDKRTFDRIGTRMRRACVREVYSSLDEISVGMAGKQGRVSQNAVKAHVEFEFLFPMGRYGQLLNLDDHDDADAFAYQMLLGRVFSKDQELRTRLAEYLQVEQSESLRRAYFLKGLERGIAKLAGIQLGVKQQEIKDSWQDVAMSSFRLPPITRIPYT